ncbi:MAG: NAD(P)-dependent alcohol dehydrogenase [Betaproteobacteria bacterium HGW-Betaproteobacteria-18]|jgi:aryl-alcohol dehydrogenase|nr:MAG: NAD(P)-dependent alcohol dehydrogenase [Betaproteobacteria bacterium HGW-Betaproteobacteria-6]PKO62704.1 MAG: NAD(P)-dependent alcohol dehydrogenase [Betaproteobacteria bacterium HGW-Betaproteobacteria-18]PKO91444.1 MAG: NAD(P)-dependent alcohol dehydrogenase [Betaproteobacteria bacterium HGW-Betaproteobacteria-10]
MQITAAVAREKGGAFSLETLELEEPRAGEVLVRVVATGVCHTDMVVRDGHLPTPMPVVLGHEGSGVVEKVGAGVSKVAVGDHVVMTFNSCGHCPSCAEHEPAYCHEFFPRNFFGTRADGSSALSRDGEVVHGNFFGQSSFASHAICHQQNVVKVPKDADLALLGPLACGIQTGAGAVINALQLKAGKSFVVFGAGSVGLSALMAAKAKGAAQLVAVDTNDDRLAFAKTIGATHTFNPLRDDVVAALLAITGYGIDYAVDTTGIPAVMRNAVMSLAPRGTCGILGASPMGTELSLDEVHFMSGGRRLVGIVEGSANPDEFIPQLIEMYRRGDFPFDRMVRFYPFNEINAAIHDSETGKSIKPIVRIG